MKAKVKPKNYAGKITQLVTKALQDDAEGLTPKEILFAVLNSEELTLADLMQSLDEVKGVEAA